MPRRPYRILCALNAAILAGLVTYAVTWSFIWDESFHVLAAQLIRLGKKPYLDFCFPQTPLNAYLNAGLIAVFGNHWQPIHVLAAFCTACAIFLIADYLYRDFPIAGWKLATAIFASLAIVSIYTLIRFASTGQANGICLAFTVASFRLATAAVRRARPRFVFASGLCAGIAAASSLLVAAAIPVILLWTVFKLRPRWKIAALFASGTLIPFAPAIWLFSLAPRQTLFNLVLYQALYRRVHWNGTTPHDFEVFLGLGQSPDALILLLLAAGGLLFLARTTAWPATLRSEYRLATWIALALAAEAIAAHPTFERYFILTVPFLAIPAAAGFFAAGSRLTRRPWQPLIVVACIFTLSLADQIYEDRDLIHWNDMQQVAAKVAEVSPPGSKIYADEMIYFLTGLPVPDGIQFSYGHRLNLPDADEALYHVLSQQHLDALIRAKIFAIVETCTDGEADRLNLDALYAHHTEIAGCGIYWTPAHSSSK